MPKQQQRQQQVLISPRGWRTLGIECKGVLPIRERKVGREQSWCNLNSEYHKALNCSLLYSHLRKQVNGARLVVSPLWRGQGNIQGFILDGKSYRLG